jgi:FtsP/CotA-like multicopper oxidase with cupredoxin domain
MRSRSTDSRSARGTTRSRRRSFPNQPGDAGPEPSGADPHDALRRENGQWTINGQTWDDVVASGFTSSSSPGPDTVRSGSSATLGRWHHPLHIHFIDFKVLSRNGRPPMPHERGAKDVVFLGENETVRC